MIPGLKDIFDCSPVNDKNCPNPIRLPDMPTFANLGDLLSVLINIAFFAAIFLSFVYLVWGSFSYIMAQGKKEDLAKARARITWAILGLIIVLLAFFVAKFIGEVFKPGTGGLPF